VECTTADGATDPFNTCWFANNNACDEVGFGGLDLCKPGTDTLDCDQARGEVSSFGIAGNGDKLNCLSKCESHYNAHDILAFFEGDPRAFYDWCLVDSRLPACRETESDCFLDQTGHSRFVDRYENQPPFHWALCDTCNGNCGTGNTCDDANNGECNEEARGAMGKISTCNANTDSVDCDNAEQGAVGYSFDGACHCIDMCKDHGDTYRSWCRVPSFCNSPYVQLSTYLSMGGEYNWMYCHKCDEEEGKASCEPGDTCMSANNGVCDEPPYGGKGCSNGADTSDCRGRDVKDAALAARALSFTERGCPCLSRCLSGGKDDTYMYCVEKDGCDASDAVECLYTAFRDRVYPSTEGKETSYGSQCGVCNVTGAVNGDDNVVAAIDLQSSFTLLKFSYANTTTFHKVSEAENQSKKNNGDDKDIEGKLEFDGSVELTCRECGMSSRLELIFELELGRFLTLKTLILKFKGTATFHVTLELLLSLSASYQLDAPVPEIDSLLRHLAQKMTISLGPFALFICPSMEMRYALELSAEAAASAEMGVQLDMSMEIGFEKPDTNSEISPVSRSSAQITRLGPKFVGRQLTLDAKLTLIPMLGLRLFTIVVMKLKMAPYITAHLEGEGSLEYTSSNLWHGKDEVGFAAYYGLDVNVDLHLDFEGFLQHKLYNHTWTMLEETPIWRPLCFSGEWHQNIGTPAAVVSPAHTVPATATITTADSALTRSSTTTTTNSMFHQTSVSHTATVATEATASATTTFTTSVTSTSLEHFPTLGPSMATSASTDVTSKPAFSMSTSSKTTTSTSSTSSATTTSMTPRTTGASTIMKASGTAVSSTTTSTSTATTVSISVDTTVSTALPVTDGSSFSWNDIYTTTHPADTDDVKLAESDGSNGGKSGISVAVGITSGIFVVALLVVGLIALRWKRAIKAQSNADVGPISFDNALYNAVYDPSTAAPGPGYSVTAATKWPDPAAIQPPEVPGFDEGDFEA
jgi:hypothetical protein